MTGIEALKNMCEECERSKIGRTQLCPFRSISNDYCEEYEAIKKELKALKIIKNHKLLNYVIKNKKCAAMYHLNDEEINILKEVAKYEINNNS